MNTEKQQQFVLYQSRYQQRVFAFVLSLVHDWNNAEEVVQSASVVMWEKFDQFQPGTNFLHWANKIAFYEVKKLRAGQSKAGVVLTDEVLEKLVHESTEMEPALEGQLAALSDCLERLPEKDCRLIRARYQGGVSTGAIAAELGRSVESVCNSLKRIRKSLLCCVQRRQLSLAGE